MPLYLQVWYFTPEDGNGMVTAFLATVTESLPDNKKNLTYTDLSNVSHPVTQVPHGTDEWQPNVWRSFDEAGDENPAVTHGGMSSSR